MILPYLFIAPSNNKGRGVYTQNAIPKNTIIEIAPVIVMEEQDRKLLDQTLLHDYIFVWGKEERQCAMALGYVPIYNHQFQSNCEYEMDYEEQLIYIKTVQDVAAGEELFINYNGTWNNPTPVWFDTATS